MLLTSVILVLQETLEVALLISVLLAISYHHRHSSSWLIYAICIGLVFAFIYANNMASVSEWFEYTGQEVMNALLQVSIALLIAITAWILLQAWGNQKTYNARLFFILSTLTVILAVTHEGSEMLIYLMGFYHQVEFFQTVIIGSFIGLGIGISVGVLILYGLRSLQDHKRIITSISIFALFAGNMLSQASLQLTQADWLPTTGIIWDSSAFLSEGSLAGKLFYALVGYEATPSGTQAVAYAAGIMLVLIASVLALKMRPSKGGQ